MKSLGLASTIKTHHNDTTLVRKLRDEGRVIEPLKVGVCKVPFLLKLMGRLMVEYKLLAN